MDMEEIYSGSFSDPHPAHYDQKTAEAAEKLQKSDAFILYVWNNLDEEEDGDSTGLVIIGRTPGTPTGSFLTRGITQIWDVIARIASDARKEHGDGEAKG